MWPTQDKVMVVYVYHSSFVVLASVFKVLPAGISFQVTDGGRIEDNIDWVYPPIIKLETRLHVAS